MPFKSLKEAPIAMTAHAVYECSSKLPLTVSKKSFEGLVRKEIGYNALKSTTSFEVSIISMEWKTLINNLIL